MSFVLYDYKLMAFGRHEKAWEEPTLEDPANLIGTLREMTYAMKEQAAAAHRMIEQIGKQLEEGHGGNPIGAEVDLEY